MACSTRLSCFLHLRGKLDSSKQLTKADFRFFPWGTLIIIRWRKTVQFCEQVVEIPLPCIPCSKLCPTTAILHAFSFTPPAPDSQAFNWVEASMHPKLAGFYLSNQFLRKLRDHLALVVSILCYKCMGHSVCRGGASFAYTSPAFSYSS